MSRPPEDVVSSLRAVLSANRGMHAELPTPPVSPELDERIERLRTANPGIDSPPLQEPTPPPSHSPEPAVPDRGVSL